MKRQAVWWYAEEADGGRWILKLLDRRSGRTYTLDTDFDSEDSARRFVTEVVDVAWLSGGNAVNREARPRSQRSI